MKDEHKTDTKHQHTYNLNITIKGISYAAIIAVLGFLGFGGDNLSANGEKDGGLNSKHYLMVMENIKSLEVRIDKLTSLFSAREEND